jgi:serine/threonine-protein kinase
MSSEQGGDSPPPASRVGTVVAQRYKLLAQLGAGGIGTVYLAEDVVLRVRVAVKLLRPEYSEEPEVLARFEREASAMAALAHEHIVQAMNFGRTREGDICLVMEYVEGETLRDALNRLKPFPLWGGVEVARQLGSALARAHGLGIVHRDLKPENVMVAWAGEGRPHVKVLDFGMARVLGGTFGSNSPLTRKGAVFGTPEYMPPEQAMGQPVDARADQYALGVICFEMLAGRRPFRADSPIDMLQAQIHQPPPWLHEAVPGVPQEVAAVVRRMMAKRPDERFPDVAQASSALQTAAQGTTPGGAPAAGAAPGAGQGAAGPDESQQRPWWRIFSPGREKR